MLISALGKVFVSKEKKRGKNGENLKGAAQIGLNESVPLLPPTLLSSGKRENSRFYSLKTLMTVGRSDM